MKSAPSRSNLLLNPFPCSHPNWPTPMATASAGGSLSTASASLVPTPTPTPAPRFLLRRSTKPTARASPTPRPKKPPPLSCATAATPVPAPASKSVRSWRDLCSLNAWVVRDYHRLVDSVGALEPALRRLSDEQVACGTNTPLPSPSQRVFHRFSLFANGSALLGVADVDKQCARLRAVEGEDGGVPRPPNARGDARRRPGRCVCCSYLLLLLSCTVSFGSLGWLVVV
jgi:hypothetical protein